MALEECRDKRLRKVGSKMHGKANNISASKRHIKSLISFLFPSNGRSAALYPDGKQTLRVLPSSTVAVHLFDFEGEDYDAEIFRKKYRRSKFVCCGRVLAIVCMSVRER